MTERSQRHTICDGSVITFARAFVRSPGILGENADARGPYEVSASRNAVCVHNAELKSDEAVEEFIRAVREAQTEARKLAREGRHGNYRLDNERCPTSMTTSKET